MQGDVDVSVGTTQHDQSQLLLHNQALLLWVMPRAQLLAKCDRR
jgi:hypothetical protein